MTVEIFLTLLVFFSTATSLATEAFKKLIGNKIPYNILVLIIMGLGKGVFSNLFKMKPFQFAGNISMECYLLHQPILLTYASFVQMENTLRGTVFYIMFNFGFTILLSALLHLKSN